MRVLLVGEYSRLHYTLAEGLRFLGHDVTVASDGDGFKNYPRDIDLTRKDSSVSQSLKSFLSVFRQISKLKGYDIVQVVNPSFTTQNILVNSYLYNILRRNNKRVFLGAFGDDSYWVRACLSKSIFRYSEFNVNGEDTNLNYNRQLIRRWLSRDYDKINSNMAKTADGIVACLYEYFKSYEPYYSNKLAYIPLPVNVDKIVYKPIVDIPSKIVFFIGINKARSEYKGTDIMAKALDSLLLKYPEEVVVLSGGEPEMYSLLGEDENRPIINVYPTEEDVFKQLERLVLNKHIIPNLSKNGHDFVCKYHDYISVAQQYIDFWNKQSSLF